MGSALHVTLPSGLKSGSVVKLAVAYKTTAACSALQWLPKECVSLASLELPLLTTLDEIDRRREIDSHIFSVNANPSTLVP